jgi:hypothetical protein
LRNSPALLSCDLVRTQRKDRRGSGPLSRDETLPAYTAPHTSPLAHSPSYLSRLRRWI